MRMMKTTGRVTSCCVALFLVLTSVSAVQRLDSIDDLKQVDFGQSVRKHSLLLLHWFANTVDITNTGVIRLNFDPERDYGSHRYRNQERMLESLPLGYRYYTIGNLGRVTSMEIPPYVVHPRTGYQGNNRDRIIIRVTEQRIDQVYITQHSPYQRTYDPDHTYQITTNLLRQIRQFSVGENQQQLSYLRNLFGSNANVSHIRNTWGELACLGLFLFIVIEEKYSSNHRNNRPENQSETVVHICDDDDDDDEDHTLMGNRETGNYTSVPTNDNQDFCCYLCCIFGFILIGFLILWFTLH